MGNSTKNPMKCSATERCQSKGDRGHRGMCSKHYKAHLRGMEARGELVRGQTSSDVAKRHIQTLLDAGMNRARIARAAGLSEYGLRLVIEKRDTIRRDTEAKILSVTPHQAVRPDAGLVPVLGTRRRLQALVAGGHSMVSLCRELGKDDNFVHAALNLYDRIYGTDAKAVAELFERLQLVDGGSSRARNRAKREGWPPPMAWDEDTIDDPDAEPYGAREDKRPKGWWFDSYRELREMGIADTHLIAERLGVPFDRVDRQVNRWKSAS